MIEDGIDIAPYVREKGHHFIIGIEKN